MKKIHLIGIGGAGLSAIATVLLQQGYTVSGSDMAESDNTQRLRTLGATVHVGHNAANLADPDIIIISSAIKPDNPEIAVAEHRQIPLLKRPAWLGQMMTGKRGIAIAGTHGKTTTTAMVSLIMAEAGLDPTYIVGGFIPQLQGSAAAGQSDWFVIEADEYDHTFLSLKPEIAVILNIEWDHPDIYPTEAAYYQAFADFASLVPADGRVIVCGDDPGTQAISAPKSTYGFEAQNDWQAINLHINDMGGYSFDVQHEGHILTATPISLTVPGKHNVLNALASIVVAETVGISPDDAGQIVSTFQGTGRRFEVKGEVNGVTVVDDYAHHPTEVKTSLAAARARYGNRAIWAVFQPHSYSRTKLLLDEFAASFEDADHVIILDIYPAREVDDGTISSQDLLTKMAHSDTRHIGPIPAAVTYLQTHVSPSDVVITLSAGDGYKVGEGILSNLTKVIEHG